jgi:hypothetical protein
VRLHLCIGAVAALLSLPARIARADEGGVSFWIAGFFASLAATPHDPRNDPGLRSITMTRSPPAVMWRLLIPTAAEKQTSTNSSFEPTTDIDVQSAMAEAMGAPSTQQWRMEQRRLADPQRPL